MKTTCKRRLVRTESPASKVTGQRAGPTRYKACGTGSACKMPCTEGLAGNRSGNLGQPAETSPPCELEQEQTNYLAIGKSSPSPLQHIHLEAVFKSLVTYPEESLQNDHHAHRQNPPQPEKGQKPDPSPGRINKLPHPSPTVPHPSRTVPYPSPTVKYQSPTLPNPSPNLPYLLRIEQHPSKQLTPKRRFRQKGLFDDFLSPQR